MHVEIHEGVKDWIRSKGNQLTVQIVRSERVLCS